MVSVYRTIQEIGRAIGEGPLFRLLSGRLLNQPANQQAGNGTVSRFQVGNSVSASLGKVWNLSNGMAIDGSAAGKWRCMGNLLCGLSNLL